MVDKLGDGLKKVILAGIGVVATTAEKSKDVLDDMVKKGELTVEQGKILNQELKHNIKETVKENVNASVKAEKAAEANEPETNEPETNEPETDVTEEKVDE